MRRAAFRALVVCAVLLLPGPHTGSSTVHHSTSAGMSSVVLLRHPKTLIPEVVAPPSFLLARLGTPRTPRAAAVRNTRLAPPSPRSIRRPVQPATSRYQVVEGDSLWSIAQRFGTTVEALAAANGISEADVLHPGQVLRVPRGKVRARRAPSVGSTYTVRKGDTLWAIARRTGVRVEDLKAANGMRGDRLQIGQKLVIPRRSVAVPSSAKALPRIRRAAYVWPARGVVTSRFGVRWRQHHRGIDIAAPRGTLIRAAREGRVVRTGWYGGYGLLVVVNHGDGVETWYGHASAVLVRVGQRVRRGQVIARVGCTGACTGPHVHFEVRLRGRPVDPLRYLPR